MWEDDKHGFSCRNTGRILKRANTLSPPHAELNFLFQHVWDGLPGSREGRRVTKAAGFCWDNSEPNKARLFTDISDIISQRPSYPQHPAPFLLTKTASFESIWIQKKMDLIPWNPQGNQFPFGWWEPLL